MKTLREQGSVESVYHLLSVAPCPRVAVVIRMLLTFLHLYLDGSVSSQRDLSPSSVTGFYPLLHTRLHKHGVVCHPPISSRRRETVRSILCRCCRCGRCLSTAHLYLNSFFFSRAVHDRLVRSYLILFGMGGVLAELDTPFAKANFRALQKWWFKAPFYVL